MKILHTSDWHLGLSQHQRAMTDDQEHVIGELCGIIRREQVDLVLCAGDMFDSSRSNPEALRMYNRALTAICAELHVPMVVIAGNHDSSAQIASMSSLVAASGLTLRGKLTRDIVPVCFENGHVCVYPVPYFGSDEVMFLFPEKREEIAACRNRTEAAMRVVCDHIRGQMDPDCVNILVAHAFIVDAVTDGTDHAASVGTAASISREVFDGFDYVALGHIHKPQIISDRVRYCGSPMVITFGREEAQEKGAVLLDTDTMRQTFVPIRPLHRFVSVTGTRSELMARSDLASDYLSVTVTDRIAELSLINELRERFPNVLEVHGMDTEGTGAGTSLSIDEVESMSEEDILRQFFRSNAWEEPEEAQLALFRAAMEDVDGERDEL